MKEKGKNLQHYDPVGEVVSIFQRGSRWYAHYRLDGKPVRQTLKTGSKKEARRKAAALERGLINGQLNRPNRAPSLGSVIDEYIAHLEAKGRSPKTITKYKYCYNLVLEIAAIRGIRRIDQIDLAFIDAFRRSRYRNKAKSKEKAKPKTTRNYEVTIKQLLNFAVRRCMIRENPLAELELTKSDRTPQPFWTRDQVEEILKKASPHYQPLFSFLADTGTRIGEARWLTWDDVDLSNMVAHVRPKEGWRPKTGDQRVIHLSKGLCCVLGELPRSAKWVFTAARTDREPVPGRQISDRRALAHLKTVLKKLNLPGHLHTFRHSFISHALFNGAKESTVRKWVGHVDHQILKIYTHIADHQSRQVMDMILPSQTPPQQL